jgi:hypothetical protein
MRFQTLVFAACAGVALLTAAPAARADGGWDHDGWRRHGHWEHGPRGPYWARGYYPPAVVYAPPPVVYRPPAVVYAPPPVVYAPPPPVVYGLPGISLGINIPIR